MPVHNQRQYQIFVKGKVQRAWFRENTEDLADELGLSGYVKNSPKKEVFILVEGDITQLEKFKEGILSFPSSVKVKSIQVTEHPFEGIYDEFSIIRGDYMDELIEKTDMILYYLESMDRRMDWYLTKWDHTMDLPVKSPENPDIDYLSKR